MSYETHREDIGHCQACGRTTDAPPRWWRSWYRLERAHLGSGGSCRKRLEDVRCVVVLCSACHAINHGARVTLPVLSMASGKSVSAGFKSSTTIPPLATEHLFWIKRERDPDNWDPEWLLANYWLRKVLPECVEPPEWYQERYAASRGGLEGIR